MSKFLKIIIFLLGIFIALELIYFIRINLAPKKPTQQVSTTIVPPIGKQTLTVQADIKSASISVELQNLQYLQDKLNQVDFWGVDKVTIYNDSGSIKKMASVSNIVVVLTDKKQPLGESVSILEDGSKHVFQSFGSKYDDSNKQLTLFLYLDSNILLSEPMINLEIRYSDQVLSTIFDLTHPLLPKHKSFNERLAGKDFFMKEFNGDPKSHSVFLIQRNE